jgi:hypothetical protein
MIVRGFGPVAWVAAVGAAALCCYMLSLQVAAERAELAGLERRIVETRQDIRSLQTELGTRGRLQQLEHWNAEVLALSAPVAGQFLESNLSLARFDVQPRIFDDAEVRLASAQPAPAAPSPIARAPVRLAAAAVQSPAVRLAAASTQPSASRPAQAMIAPSQPLVRRTSEPLVRRASLTVVPAPAAPASRPAPQTRSSLLDESTLSDLRAESRSERGGGTRN